MKLGVNIDHIAVLREARGVFDPSPIDALLPCMLGGADQITIHLREDRRHICDFDAKTIASLSKLPLNIECSVDPAIVDIICDIRPHRVTIVPEKREEVTTEGGLDLHKNGEAIKNAIMKFKETSVSVSLFIDPSPSDILLSKELGADAIELHTGKYSNLFLVLNSNIQRTHHALEEFRELSRYELEEALKGELESIEECAKLAKKLGLFAAAGHGLNYQNVAPVAAIEEIEELNIGQSIIARSVFTGLIDAVKEMKRVINEAKNSH